MHRRIWICFFAVILPDGVIFDEAMSDQVRLHHVIFLEKVVLAANACTNDALLTQTHTVFFPSGNFSHVPEKPNHF
jgi:hypothetical protein